MKSLKNIFAAALIILSAFTSATAGEWQIDLSAVVFDGSLVIKNELVAGVRLNATGDFDPLWDVHQSSSSFSNSSIVLDAYFNHPAAVLENSKLWRDIRNISLPATWGLEVDLNTNVKATLFWKLPNLEDCNRPAFELYDVLNNTIVDMQTIDNHTFTGSGSFEIRVSPGTAMAAPASPDNLFSLLDTDNSILFAWDKSSDPNFKGYNVYRKEESGASGNTGSNFVKINSELLLTNKFFDSNLNSSKLYTYHVTVVGKCESYPSLELLGPVPIQ